MNRNINLKGLVTASVTPMKPDYSINYDRIPDLVEYMISRKNAAIYVLGSTGEGALLTDRERRAVAVKFVEAAQGRIPIIIQVGHNSFQASRELAEHAEDIGADAISAHPPVYFKPSNEADLIDGINIICGSTKLPFYYYHIPSVAPAPIDILEFTALAHQRVENFAGVKYSDPGTFYHLKMLQENAPGATFFSGADEFYLMSLCQGYEVAVGSTYGYAAELYHKVFDCYHRGDLEEALMWQNTSIRLIHDIFRCAGRSGLKLMWKFVGIDCGPSRPPLNKINELGEKDLERIFSEVMSSVDSKKPVATRQHSTALPMKN